jgi:phospholipid/cholesterol/gamma-HCH transport system permease protein
MATATLDPPSMLVSTEGPGTRVTLRGPLTLQSSGPLWADLEHFRRSDPELPIEIDVTDVSECDTAGVALIRALSAPWCQREEDLSLVGASPSIVELLRLAGQPCDEPEDEFQHEKALGLFDTAGAFALDAAGHVRGTVEYIGGLTAALIGVVLHPRQVRWNDVGIAMARAGADAFVIVALASVLIGVVIGFQSVNYLERFGLAGYLPKAVSIGVVRQLGPLMTAIVVAGRSGSGFAAEIGTMKVNEEVAALETMGLDRTKFLVLPKLIALLVVMPFLVIFSDACGVLGGMIMGIGLLDFSIASYLGEAAESLTAWDVTQGLIMGQGYAIVIASVGCLRGLQTSQSARGVGVSTTSAVVTAIFLIICVDALFSGLFYAVNPDTLTALFNNFAAWISDAR